MRNYKKFIFTLSIIGISIFTSCSDDDEATTNCFSCQFDSESLFAELNGIDICEGIEMEDDEGNMVPMTAADITELKASYEMFGGTCN
jgi:hypothetical protein